MDSDWWVTVVRAWPQVSEKSGLVIRMINSFGETTDDRWFASIDEALSQLRCWLEELEQAPVERQPDRRERDGDTTQRTWPEDA